MSILLISSCDCERELVCDSITSFQDDNDLLDSVSLITPNAILDKEQAYNFLHVGRIGLANLKEIESYEFEIEMKDVFSFNTSDPSFVFDGNRITIPKENILGNVNFLEGYVDFSLKIFFVDQSGFVTLNGELLLVTCASFLSGELDNKDCRYSYNLIPSQEQLPFICS